MKTLETLQGEYQARHDALKLGGQAKQHDDGEGRVAFWNCDQHIWDWYAWDQAHGYTKTGTTYFV